MAFYGPTVYRQVQRLLITADSGGSNGSRVRLWTLELQKLVEYQGDELGMTNYPFRSVEDFDDVEVRGQWRQLVETGLVPVAEYLDHVRQTSRDNSRTPMQWSAEPHGGFTSGQPWLAVNPNNAEINVAAQLEESDSVFHHHQRLIALRRQAPALVHGAYLDNDSKYEQVFAYTRTLGDELTWWC